MTQPLLNPTEFAQFQAKDPAWFLDAAGETIREYCGWHIYPQLAVTNIAAEIGNQGIIMLPTLNLVSVEALRLILPPGPVAATSDTFIVNSAGYIQFYGWFARQMRGVKVSVDFTHGFDTVPKTIAEVGYELAARTLEKPAGVVTDMTRGPTKMTFTEFGAVLSDDQKARLGPYTLQRV